MGLSLAVALIYWPSAKALDGVWRGSAGHAYLHGYLLLLASLWLIVRGRERLAEFPIRPARGAWPLVLVLSAAWVWSWGAVIQDPQLLLMPLLWLAAIAAVLGWRASRALVIPIGLLFLAMPALGDINGILQQLSARANGVLIWLTGIPAYMHGDFIELPAGTLQVAGGCSGLDTFLAGLSLATLYGEICRNPWRRKLTWLALMGALALICNWLRIFIVTVVAYESDMRASLVRRHLWLGWVLFLMFFIAFLWMAEAWDRSHPLGIDTPRTPKVYAESRINPMSAVLTLIFLAILPMLAYGAGLLRTESAASVSIEWPRAPRGWSGPQPLLASDWRPHFVNPSAQSLREYVDPSGDRTVEVYAVVYRSQAQNAKLLGFLNNLLGSAHRLRAQSEHVVNSSNGRWSETLAINAAGNRSLVWSRYLIGKRRFVRPGRAQLWYGLVAPISAPDSSLVALRATCWRECGGARALLEVGAERLLPTLRPIDRTQGDTAP